MSNIKLIYFENKVSHTHRKRLGYFVWKSLFLTHNSNVHLLSLDLFIQLAGFHRQYFKPWHGYFNMHLTNK